MIILKLKTEDELTKKQILRRKKTKKAQEPVLNYSRSGIVINNKPHFVVAVTADTLADLEFRTMLGKYKGEIIPCEKLEKNTSISQLYYDVTDFKKQALFSSFKRQILNKRFINSRVLFLDENFTLKNEIFEVVPYIKQLTVSTENLSFSDAWCQKCFVEYGVKPRVVKKGRVTTSLFDVVADFDSIKENELRVQKNGESFTVYPDYKFLEVPSELKILEELEISKTMICAAFKTV